ncbi:SOS response-associated peptidase family protein [Sphingopyxis panaciterrulae]|uniref:Putative SOS response-associated peptidase YedK n=1 Tax=Sphingopyxis panaciterrulae TaxID=462372 RepID=A0A7W9B9C7_9SPHN|nr:SOS response-associated peptidase family protein [Sphingopyxis panaciterrulae]MBB5708626.1 putative SOS response-associated peptidase YedK [Sphingopyxis panaciterrulae]
MGRWRTDGLRVATNLFKCATWHYAVKPVCRCGQATNAAPGDVWKGGTGFVVREDDGARVLDAMHWGFPRHSMNKRTGAPNKPAPVNNARDDKLMSHYGMWREWFVQPAHRCLIPFAAFAEAEGAAGAMTKTWISVADQPLAA